MKRQVTITMKFEVDDSTQEAKEALEEMLSTSQEEFLEEYDGSDGIKGVSIEIVAD